MGWVLALFFSAWLPLPLHKILARHRLIVRPLDSADGQKEPGREKAEEVWRAWDKRVVLRDTHCFGE
jgi:hypothetical protein